MLCVTFVLAPGTNPYAALGLCQKRSFQPSKPNFRACHQGRSGLNPLPVFWPRSVDHALDLWQGFERQSAREDLRGDGIAYAPHRGRFIAAG